jgi:hypothetical protein
MRLLLILSLAALASGNFLRLKKEIAVKGE